MSAEIAGPLETPLFDLHHRLGARMVEFAGYSMPVSYPAGIVKEHLWTREAAGLFDVSHMGQLRVSGERAAAALESLIPLDIAAMPAGRQRYSVLTNDAGGIIDDLIVARLGDAFVLVVNAACKHTDLQHLQTHLGDGVAIELLDERALIALQGPAAAAVMSRITADVEDMEFMEIREVAIGGAACLVSRSGYTGEDGFEISVPADAADEIAVDLLQQPETEPVGLGARDSLRLEAGLCLYGHDLDATTTPVEAGLQFAISPARRAGGARAGGFPGANVILAQLEHGAARARVSLLPDSRVPVREGNELFDAARRRVGTVTSGGFGPSLGAPVAMAYVESAAARAAAPLHASVRGREISLRIAATPVVPHRYKRS